MTLFTRRRGDGRFTTDRLTRSDARVLRREARATASAGWAPQDSQPEPPYLGVWDNAMHTAQTRAREDFFARMTPLLTLLERWLSTQQVTPPRRGSVGAEARGAAQDADYYRQLTAAKDEALTRYDLAVKSLTEQLNRVEMVRRSGRHLFWSTMIQHHPQPDKLDTTPPAGPVGRAGGAIDEPLVVTEARRRTHAERT
jgi:hypothetical protein